MRPILSPAEARRIDREAGVSTGVLMERAGLAVAIAATRMGAAYGRRVVVLAGSGNNGGDGYVAARHLATRGVAVEVHRLGDPELGTAAGTAAEEAAAAGIPIYAIGDPAPCALVVDALFGIGFRGELPPAAATWAGAGLPVLAVDVPSGLDAETGRAAALRFAASHTVTFHTMKVGHVIGDGPDVCGTIEVADIGLTGGEPTLLLAEAGDAPRPERRRLEHKWSAGAVLVVGGGAGLTGAALLAAMGALRSGAGAVAIAAPEAAARVYTSLSPDVLVRPVGKGDRFVTADADEIVAVGERFDALVLGPGLGETPAGFVDRVVATWPGTLVLDADGLNGLGGVGVLGERPGPTVLTPHGGEFSRLTGGEASVEAAAALAADTGSVVLLKGNPTIVASEAVWVVASGGPELATIGTGDVLAGMIGAFTAAGLPAAVAARSAAFHHGEAGRRLAAGGSRFLASELAAEVGR